MQRRSFLQGILAAIPGLGICKTVDATSQTIHIPKPKSTLWGVFTEERLVRFYIESLKKNGFKYEAVESTASTSGIHSWITIPNKYFKEKRFDIIARDLYDLEDNLVNDIRRYELACQTAFNFHDLQVLMTEDGTNTTIDVAVGLHRVSDLVITYDHIKAYAKRHGFEIVEDIEEDRKWVIHRRLDNNDFGYYYVAHNVQDGDIAVPLLHYEELCRSYEKVIEVIKDHVEQSALSTKRFLYVTSSRTKFGILSFDNEYVIQDIHRDSAWVI